MEKYNYEQIRAIFNESDPVGLFSEDSVDEYELEINKFISALPDLTTFDDFRESIKTIFATSFEGLHIKQEYLDLLARKLFELLRQH